MMFIFIINDYPILHCTGQISRLCLLLGELYGSDNRVLFYLYGKKDQLVWLSERRVLKLRLLRVVTPEIKSIYIGSFMESFSSVI